MRGRAHWVGLAVGGGVLAFGVAGLARNHAQTMPGNALQFIIGALVVHDAGWALFVAGLSAILVRVLPARVRPFAMGGLAISAVLVLVAVPALTGNGRLANNPSILPRDYWHGLGVALAATWLVTAALAVRAVRRGQSASDSQT